MKILLVNDHVLTRETLRDVLKELKGDATVLEAADGRQALPLIEEHADLGLILLDLNLPDRDGFSLLAELRNRHPGVSIVVLSGQGQYDRASLMRALDLGALGVIPKHSQREVMLSALQLVFSGGIYIPHEILARVEQPPPQASPPRADATPVSPADLGLTGRQVEVLALMMQGKSNKAICRVLELAEPTVKNHVTSILKALKVSNRTEAVIAVNELGWELPPIAESLHIRSWRFR